MHTKAVKLLLGYIHLYICAVDTVELSKFETGLVITLCALKKHCRHNTNGLPFNVHFRNQLINS